MKNIYKILLIGLIFASFALARTSGKYEAPESFMRAKISGSTKKAYVPTENNENEGNDSIKWKRRHKRRKKDKKRKPSRGR